MSFTVGSFGQIKLQEDFEEVALGALPVGWSFDNGSGLESSQWKVADESIITACQGSKYLFSDFPDGAAQDNWVFTDALSLDAGSYKLSFRYRVDIDGVAGKLAVKYGSGATIANMTNEIVEYNTFSNTNCALSIAAFEVAFTGTYHLGWPFL